MGKLGLIFTTDYEIFGNGTGDIESCMLKPAAKMARILEDYGAPLTVFLDVCEYWAFQKEYEEGNLEIDWAGRIGEQLREMLQRGHDVQLHFHPQWLNYTCAEGGWQLDYDLWRIGKLKYDDPDHPERSLKNLFPKGKKSLEDMLRPVKASYECNSFRAGAWSMQPESEVLKAMRESGFKLDSTVAPEMQFEDDFTFYDFRNAPDAACWRIKDDLRTPHKDGLLEVPIFTCHVPLHQKLKFLWLKKKKGLQLKAPGCTGTALASAGKNKLQKLREVLGSGHSMFNFSDATSSEEMIYFTQQAIKRFGNRQEELLPVVAISHPKTFANAREFENFMAWASDHEAIVFSSFQQFIRKS